MIPKTSYLNVGSARCEREREREREREKELKVNQKHIGRRRLEV
jgi:hypothetical protein